MLWGPGGVPVDRLQARHAKRNFVLALGRVCPEKGFHLALDAVERAGVPLLIAGQVFPYPSHQAYFDKQIRPRLGDGAALTASGRVPKTVNTFSTRRF